MSDSLLVYQTKLVTHDAELPASVTTLLLASRVLLMRLFESGLPARGALCLGELYADRHNGLYCGKGLVEAVQVAESQEWIGAVIADSLSEPVADLVASFDPAKWVNTANATDDFTAARPCWDVVEYDVPFKRGPRRAWIVNWASAWNAGGPVRDDFFAGRLVGDPAIDIKYHNTLQYLRNWRAESHL